MTPRTTHTGASWGDVAASLLATYEQENGRYGAQPRLPIVTVQQALAIAQALRGQLVAHRLKVPYWPELWYGLLGYERPGDRFVMTSAHAGAIADHAHADALWSLVERAAQELDARQATPVLLIVDPSWGQYQRAAADAYAQLKRDRTKKLPLPPIDPDKPIPRPPADPQLPPRPTLPSLKGAGILLALVIVYLATKD